MDYLQDAVVTAIALWAGVVVFRRVAGFVRPTGQTKPGCANCPSAQSTPRPPLGAEERPLVFVRQSRR
jgi:hypothetical protein